ncbi:hypothetical protein NMY22_g1772 [Coprinellus aureogranulatus]|nr:hypothetical protein NMY22_g1772 [Coprinellus aureogranulatus]
MGKWTPNHTDNELTNKISTLVTGALRRAAIDNDTKVANMTYENFVRELDTGDAFTATLVEILVKEVAERRTRPGTDRRSLAQRTVNSLRKLAMPLNQYPSRIRHSHMSRRPFATMLPEYDDDDDNFEMMVQEAAEGTQRSSADLYDALAIPWPGRVVRTDGEESSMRTTIPLRVRSPPTGLTASGSGTSTSLFPPPNRASAAWATLPPGPGTTLTRQASIRRPFASRNIEFNTFTRRHRATHRDGLDGEGSSDVPATEPRDEPWTTRATSMTTGPYNSSRRFLPALAARRYRRNEVQRDMARRAGILSDSSSDEDVLGLANAGAEQFLAYTGHPSMRAVLGGTSSSGAGPSSAGPSTTLTGVVGLSGPGDGFGEIPTSDERTEAVPVSTSMTIPRLRRGGLRAPESMITPSVTPPAEEAPASVALSSGPQNVEVEEIPVLEPSTEGPVAYPTPGSIVEAAHGDCVWARHGLTLNLNHHNGERQTAVLFNEMFKKRTRPPTVAKDIHIAVEEDKPIEGDGEDLTGERTEEEPNLPIADLIEWRKLRRAREGIDVTKLNVGDAKKKAKKRVREEEKGGLRKGATEDDTIDEEAAKEAKARRVVRTNNFTQQTNTLDVDKHMMAYIEENLKVRSRPKEGDEDEDESDKPYDPQDEVFKAASEKWKANLMGGTVKDGKKRLEEGSVTSSLGMLTAIPEVDLGMDTRLKNIEETEKAKRMVEELKTHQVKINPDEVHLVANRFYRPNLRAKSDADIIRDAKLEAMGLNPQDHEHAPAQHHRSNHERPQMATDEMVMERFKKRMRK